MSIKKEIQAKLLNLEKKGLKRKLTSFSKKDFALLYKNKKLVDFSSNNYLGLAKHKLLKKTAIKAIEKYGISTCSSRLISGHSSEHSLLQKLLASFSQTEASLIFNSGFDANLALITNIASNNDLVIFDELSHASFIYGALISKARLVRFKHNDLADLDYKLKKLRNKYQNAFFFTESVFSMDGDLAPLQDLLKIAKAYNCITIVDEAHAIGVFGDKGQGRLSELNLKADFIVGTFSKALGGIGGYLALSKIYQQYLINQAKNLIYTTAIPPHLCASAIKSIKIIQKNPKHKNKLWQNIDYTQAILNNYSQQKIFSAIVPILIEDKQKLNKIKRELFKKGFFVATIRPPTVKTSRIRISLSSFHSKSQIKNLFATIYNYL